MTGTEAEGSGPGSIPGVVLYRKKPVTVETMPWTGDHWDAVRRFAGLNARYFPHGDGQGAGPLLELWNSQGRAWIPCPAGYSVVKGRLGDFYPVSPAAIAETYEPAGSPAAEVARQHAESGLAPATEATPVSREGRDATEPLSAPDEITEAAAVMRNVIDGAQVVIGLKDRLAGAAKRLELAGRDAAAAERERIRDLADRNGAVCTGEEGTNCYFSALIREDVDDG